MGEENKNQQGQVRRLFRKRQTRQIIAIAVALFLVALVAVMHRRPDLFGEHSRDLLFGLQAVVIAAFIGITAANWRCPACGAFLGSDIHRTRCRKCGDRLQ